MWGGYPSRLKPSAALAALLFATVLVPYARSEEPKLSISGYDPVAYFTDGKPVPGKSEFEYSWHKLRWRFANGEHRELFAKNPDRYAPQYDGYCAMGAAAGESAHKDTVDPEAWAIVDGKLYLTHMRQAMEDWQQNPAKYIKPADENWAAVKDLPEPVILGLPCAASPPSTLVALRGGGHWVVVGPEAAHDESGKIVGKGDMGAQLEQVGKKVEACLKVGAGKPLRHHRDPHLRRRPRPARQIHRPPEAVFRQRFAGSDDCPKGPAFRPRRSRRGHGLRRGPITEGGPRVSETRLFSAL
jgi:YHS domain-containing protein